MIFLRKNFTLICKLISFDKKLEIEKVVSHMRVTTVSAVMRSHMTEKKPLGLRAQQYTSFLVSKLKKGTRFQSRQSI